MIEDEIFPLPNVGKPSSDKIPLGTCCIFIDDPELANFDPIIYITPQGEPLAKLPALDLNGHACRIWADDAEDIYLSLAEAADDDYLTETWPKNPTLEEYEVFNQTRSGRRYQPNIHPPPVDDVPARQTSKKPTTPHYGRTDRGSTLNAAKENQDRD